MSGTNCVQDKLIFYNVLIDTILKSIIFTYTSCIDMGFQNATTKSRQKNIYKSTLHM